MPTIPAYCPRCEEEWVDGQRIFQDAAGMALCRKCAMKAHLAKEKITDMPDVPAPFGDGSHRKEDATMAKRKGWSEAAKASARAKREARKGCLIEDVEQALEVRQDSQDGHDPVQSETEFMRELGRAILFLRRLDEAGRAMVLELVKGA
jgi:hypothetical protein